MSGEILRSEAAGSETLKVTLGGVPLEAFGSIGWTLTAGTEPHRRAFEVMRIPTAERLMALSTSDAQQLIVEHSGGRVMTYDGVYILGTVSGSMPSTVNVLLADGRIWWGRKWIVRDYNVRRKTGERRLLGEGLFVNRPQVDDVDYAEWSMNHGKPWTFAAIVADIVGEIGDRIDTTAISGIDLVIEDFSLSGPADIMLGRALSEVGGYAIFALQNGSFAIRDTLSSGGATEAHNSGPIVFGSGSHTRADYSPLRPKKVHVYFERDVELKFTFDEQQSHRTIIRGREERILENVLPIPEPELPINGVVVPQGTWVSVNDYLAALQAQGYGPETTAKTFLTQELIRNQYLQSTYIESRFGTDASSAFLNQLWRRRISTIRKHWRQTFRIEPSWMARIRNLSAVRVAMLDTETGTRAPSLAYMDYCVIPSNHGAFRISRGLKYGINVEGFNNTLSLATAAPAHVQILDAQQGIFRIDFIPDQEGLTDKFFPGTVAEYPEISIGNRSENVKMLLAHCPLQEEFGISVVLTCGQGSPNNLGRLHRVTIEPSDIRNAPGTMQAFNGLGACRGPDRHVFVQPSVRTARYGWSDEHASEIDSAFFEGTQYPGAPVLINEEDLKTIALGIAKNVYTTSLDAETGTFRVPMNERIALSGPMTAVEHDVAPTGHLTTRISFATAFEPRQLMALLPDALQRVIRGLVNR